MTTVFAENDLGNRKDKNNFQQEYNKHFRFRTFANWLDATKTGDFTNYCKNAEEFSSDIYFVVQKIIPWLYENAYSIFINGSAKTTPLRNSHSIKGEEVIKKVRNVAKCITGETYDDPELDWWQIGGQRGIRIVGVYAYLEPAFYPVFIDRYHLIYPSDKHNNNVVDYKNNSYTPKE